MLSDRACRLLAELLGEPGVLAALVAKGNKVNVQLELTLSDEEQERRIESLFEANGCSVEPTSNMRPENIEQENDVEPVDQTAYAEQQLLELYKQHSGRQLFKLRPDVWTSHGHWNKHYRHLEGQYVKAKKGPGGANGRVTNRPFVTLFNVNGTDVEAGFVEQETMNYQRIIIAFTRASSAPPTYGAQGMFDRGAKAAKAWSTLEPERPSLVFCLPRARVASRTPLDDKRALVGEMISILDSAADGMTVELLSVGIDGLTTDQGSFEWLQNRWGGRLNLRLVVIVQQLFSGTRRTFPEHARGIRYRVFDISAVHQVLGDHEVPGQDDVKELLALLNRIKSLKEDRGEGYGDLNGLTYGRANFRVCPESMYDSGVNEEARKTRGLHVLRQTKIEHVDG